MLYVSKIWNEHSPKEKVKIKLFTKTILKKRRYILHCKSFNFFKILKQFFFLEHITFYNKICQKKGCEKAEINKVDFVYYEWIWQIRMTV